MTSRVRADYTDRPHVDLRHASHTLGQSATRVQAASRCYDEITPHRLLFGRSVEVERPILHDRGFFGTEAVRGSRTIPRTTTAGKFLPTVRW